MVAISSNQKVQFMEGTLKPKEAEKVMLKVIDDQINHYKLQNLSSWIHDNTKNPYGDKIAKLERNKRILKEMIIDAQATGCKLSLCGDFKVALTK